MNADDEFDPPVTPPVAGTPAPSSKIASTPRRPKRWLVRIALAGVVFVVSVKLGDWLIGAALDTRTRHALRLAPNTSWRHHSDEFDYEFRTNSLGFRGPEIPFDRTKSNVRRILVVGDSFVAGHGVSEDDLFTTQWQRHLNEDRGTGSQTEVVNLGRTGTSTWGELRLFESIGRRFKPDVVVLCVYLGNDLAEIVEEQTPEDDTSWSPPGWVRSLAYHIAPNAYLELAMRRQAGQTQEQSKARTDEELLADVLAAARSRGVDEGDARRRFESLPADVLESARDGLFARHRLLQACADPDRALRSLDPDGPTYARSWHRMEDALDRVRAAVQSARAELRLVVIPSALQVSDEAQAFDRRLGMAVQSSWLKDPCGTQQAVTGWAVRNHVPLLDLTDPLRRSDEPCYFVRDGHFNPAGHSVTAHELARWLNPADADAPRTPPSRP
jgi:lysophospholipase L1-like esterase